MSDAPLINLLQVLPSVIQQSLSGTDYSDLTFVFGLDGAISTGEINQELAKVASQKRLKQSIEKALLAAKGALTSTSEDEKIVVISHEMQLLQATLKDLDNYVNSFNTEEKLLEIVQLRYKVPKLSSMQYGHILLLFFMFGFERIEIPDCEVFWKLADSPLENEQLLTLNRIAVSILEEAVKGVKYSLLARNVAAVNKRQYPDEAVLRFLLSVNRRIEFLKEDDIYQLQFHELKVKHYPYRVLLDNNREMEWREINDEISLRLKKAGKPVPGTSVSMTLSSETSLYAQGTGGWGLVEWGTTKISGEDGLEEWFRETKAPVTRDEMIAHVKSIRPDLKESSIESTLTNLIKSARIIPVMSNDGESQDQKDLYYHGDVALPKNYSKIADRKRSQTKTRTAKAPKLFISYSHDDKKWLRRFREHLDIYKDIIEIWDDKAIEEGEEWDREIKEAIQTSDLFLFLVTPALINSTYVMTEELPLVLKRRKKENVRVYWVLVESVDFTVTPFSELHAAYEPDRDLASLISSKQNDAIRKICEKIRADLSS